METNKKRSLRQETEVRDAMQRVYGNARLQPGSGNQPTRPNDVLVPNVAYFECKETSRSQITLKWAWLETLKRTSILNGLRTFLVVKFTLHSRTNYYVVEDHVFEHLLKCEQELFNLMHLETKS